MLKNKVITGINVSHVGHQFFKQEKDMQQTHYLR